MWVGSWTVQFTLNFLMGSWLSKSWKRATWLLLTHLSTFRSLIYTIPISISSSDTSNWHQLTAALTCLRFICHNVCVAMEILQVLGSLKHVSLHYLALRGSTDGHVQLLWPPQPSPLMTQRSMPTLRSLGTPIISDTTLPHTRNVAWRNTTLTQLGRKMVGL